MTWYSLRQAPFKMQLSLQPQGSVGLLHPSGIFLIWPDLARAACAQYYAPDSVTINGQACSVQLNIPLQNLLPTGNGTASGSQSGSQTLDAEVEASTARSPSAKNAPLGCHAACAAGMRASQMLTL